MKNQFDITDFGAVGDGITDCTRSIQDAMNAAQNCYGTVLVPPGKYMVSGNLKLRGQGVSLVGTSAWSFRSDGASILILNDPYAECMIDISGAFGCTVKGICLCGQDMGKNIHGIKLWWPQYNGGNEEDTPTIDDCRIDHFSGDGLHFEHVWCFSVRHSMLAFNGGAGLFIDGWDAFIIDNWFSANGNGGIKGGRTVASITCTGNRVEWNKKGGFILPSGDSYNITGNFFDRSFGPAIDLGTENSGVHLVTVTGNIFRRSGARKEDERFDDPQSSAHLRMQNCQGVVVSANSMRVGHNDDGRGVDSPDYSFIIRNCRECIVKDNVMNSGAMKQNMILEGDNPTCIIADNIGSEA